MDAEAKAISRRDRKRALTATSSSRWAGAITRKVEDQYQLGMRGLAAERAMLRQATLTVERRLAVEPGEVLKPARGKAVRGYRNSAEWFQKTRRLNGLRHRQAAVEARYNSGSPRLVHGGGRLWTNRAHLDQAGMIEQEWRVRWDAARWFFTADGETGKKYGNETIRVTPDGNVSIKIPAGLPHLIEKHGTHLNLSTSLHMVTHRAPEWADRIHNHQSVGYTITYSPETGRWYLQAAWKYPTAVPPSLTALQGQRTLAVNTNDQFLAAWVIDPDGNPVGDPLTWNIPSDGLRAKTRDAYLRHAITNLIKHARRTGCASITVEDLNFIDARATGRETMGRGTRGKKFRRIVAGIPTGQFRDRLVAMASQADLPLVAVDPAYTSRWGGEHWLKPLQTSRPATTRHHAASVVIGRRMQHHTARRRPGMLPVRQRTHQNPHTRTRASNPAHSDASTPGAAGDAPPDHESTRTSPT